MIPMVIGVLRDGLEKKPISRSSLSALKYSSSWKSWWLVFRATKAADVVRRTREQCYVKSLYKLEDYPFELRWVMVSCRS
ncbi:unnamed protein product, partial [Linum tenue]